MDLFRWFMDAQQTINKKIILFAINLRGMMVSIYIFCTNIWECLPLLCTHGYENCIISVLGELLIMYHIGWKVLVNSILPQMEFKSEK